MEFPPPEAESFRSWLGNMWRVPAVREYGLTPEQHFQYRREMEKSDSSNYDFLLENKQQQAT